MRNRAEERKGATIKIPSLKPLIFSHLFFSSVKVEVAPPRSFPARTRVFFTCRCLGRCAIRTPRLTILTPSPCHCMRRMASLSQAPPKRQKVGSKAGSQAGSLHPLLSPSLLTECASLRSTYRSAEPFPHVQIPCLFSDPSFLEAVAHECKQNLTATFKESDLFKFYQTLDLANLSKESHPELPKLLALKDAMYSSSMREYIEDVAGLDRGTLIDKMDGAINVHSRGG